MQALARGCKKPSTASPTNLRGQESGQGLLDSSTGCRVDDSHCGVTSRCLRQSDHQPGFAAFRPFLLHTNVSIDKGHRFVWVGTGHSSSLQKTTEQTPTIPSDKHTSGLDATAHPVAKLTSMPSFSSSASTLDQLLSCSPPSTEAQSAALRCSQASLGGDGCMSIYTDWLSSAGTGLTSSTPSSSVQQQNVYSDWLSATTGLTGSTAPSNSAQQHSSSPMTQPWPCDSSMWSHFPNEMDDLLDWAASEPLPVPDSTFPSPCSAEPASQEHAQHALSACDTLTSGQMWPTQGDITAPDTTDLPCCSIDDLPSAHLFDLAIAIDIEANPMPDLCDMYTAHQQHGLQALQHHTQTEPLDALGSMDNLARQDMLSACPDGSMPQGHVPSSELEESVPSPHHLSTELLILGAIGSSASAGEPVLLPEAGVDALLAAPSVSCELDALLNAGSTSSTAQEESSWLQLDRSASSSFLQQAGYGSDQLPQAGYSSETGCGSGEGNTAADSATAARKRKGGRPRVYDLDQPIPSDGAARCPPKPRGRGAKPKYVYNTPEEAVAKRRKRNRDTANNSYLKRKERTMALKQQIDGLRNEGSALSSLLELLQRLRPADQDWVRQQLMTGEAPALVTNAALQRIVASGN